MSGKEKQSYTKSQKRVSKHFLKRPIIWLLAFLISVGFQVGQITANVWHLNTVAPKKEVVAFLVSWLVTALLAGFNIFEFKKLSKIVQLSECFDDVIKDEKVNADMIRRRFQKST